MLYNLCEEIENAYENEERSVDMILRQVKSKFGHLCWYYSLPEHEQRYMQLIPCWGRDKDISKGDEDSFENVIAEIVSKYEKLSRITCESCGAEKAELRTEQPYFRWVSTLCEDCKNKRIKMFNERLR